MIEKLMRPQTVAWAILALSIPALTSCGVFTDSKKYVVNGNGVEVTKTSKPADNGGTVAPPKTAKPSKSATNKPAKSSKPALAGAGDARQPVESTNKKGKAPAQKGKTGGVLPAGFSIDGEWTIYSVRGNVVTGEERPYIFFDLGADRMYGSNGCNYINADIKCGEAGHLSIGNMAATMKSCADAPFEYLINLALSEVAGYAARQDGDDTYLELKAANGSKLMTLRRHNLEFLNGPWLVTTLNGIAMPPEGAEDAASMVIDLPQLKVHGTTGCNIINGELFVDPDKQQSLQFLNLATTRMACPPDSRETEFVLALEAAESARQAGSGLVEILDASGKQLMTLKRINYPEQQ